MPAVPGCAGRPPCVVGRAFTPAGEVYRGVMLWFCVSAASQGWGGLRQPGRVLAGRGAAPLSRLTPTAPLAGEPFRRQFPQSLPCKGRWVRRKAQTEGALPVGGGDIRKGPAGAYPVFRRGRCWHRPANLAAAPGSTAGKIARPTLRLGTGDDAEVAANRQAWRRADASIGPYAGGDGRGSVADRKGIGGARCGTPPSPAATPPLAGEAFGAAAD